MKLPSRYQLYIPLIRFFFWSKIAIWIVTTPGLPTANWQDWPMVIYLPVAILSKVALFGLMFLLGTRFMRDEYAEEMWSKAARNFSRLLVVTPFFIWSVMMLFKSEIANHLKGWDHFADPSWYKFHTPSGWITDTEIGGAAYHEYAGFGTVIDWCFIFMPFIFAGLFLWHNWRER